MSWDTYFMEMAELVASKSKDRSTKVGAVIVGPENEVRSTGYNGMPRGVNDDVEDRHERPQKYDWFEHAERNAILNAARNGVPLDGCRMYINFQPYPCPACTRAIIQSGIKQVIGPDRPFEGKGKDWLESFDISRQMMAEAGVVWRIAR